jgi:hypothetical protein
MGVLSTILDKLVFRKNCHPSETDKLRESNDTSSALSTVSFPELMKLVGAKLNPGDLRSEDEFLIDYERFRGKCKQLAEDAVRQDPTLTLVRGYYVCSAWGKQTHWWTTRPDGSVFDPACRQFPSNGRGEYIPFDGKVGCEICGKIMTEREVYRFEFSGLGSQDALCSEECYGKYVIGDITLE